MSESAIGSSRLIGGRYELDVRIGKGGIGEVWRARHLALNSLVAIKFLHGASAQNESTRRRFTTEAQVTAQLKSKHAVQVFDFGVTEDGHPYLVMELLEGETLGRRLEREGRLGIVETARILGQASRALHRAHQLGIVHRDFKPDNIVIGVDEDGRDYVKVVDFGIAKLMGDLDTSPERPELDLASTAPATTFTKTGAMLGTPIYMAPEQVRGAANVHLRADIWAFGVVAFECLTGCAPFAGDTLAELFDKIERGIHPPADKLEPSVPSGFEEWFGIACAIDPSKRFSDATTAWKKLLEALDCGKIDIDPSRSFGRAAQTGERRGVAQAEVNHVDGNAVTVDAAATKGVESRHSRRSIQNAPPAARAPTVGPVPPLPSEPAAMSHTIAEEDEPNAPSQPSAASSDAKVARRPETARGKIALVIAAPTIVLASVLVWRMTSAPATPPPAAVPTSIASAASLPAASSTPVRTLVATSSPVATSSSSPVATPSSIIVPAPSASSSSAANALRPPQSARPRAPASAPLASAASSQAAASPHAVPPPPAASATVGDPGSYR